jgi:hypothetical protein
MSKTIRMRIKQRKWQAEWGAMAILGAGSFAIKRVIDPKGWVGGEDSLTDRELVVLALCVVGLVSAVAFFWWVVGRTPCPKCRANLGGLFAVPATIKDKNGNVAERCPACGLGLDEPSP